MKLRFSLSCATAVILAACGGDSREGTSADALSSCGDVSSIDASQAITLDVDLTQGRSIPLGLSGFATEDGITAMSPLHRGYGALTKALRPGFLRWAAGTPSGGFSWSFRNVQGEGRFVDGWFADWWNETQYDRWNFALSNMSPNSGNPRYFDLLRNAVGAGGLIVEINVVHDTPANAGALAAYLYNNGSSVPVLAYEIGNEPYAIEQVTWSSSGAAYMAHVKPYIDAIIANDPRAYDIAVALQATNYGNTSSPFTAWDTGSTGVLTWLAQNGAWPNAHRVDAVTFHAYPCAAPGKDATAIANCLTGYLDGQADAWMKNVVAGAGGRKVYVTEAASGIEGNTTDIDPPPALGDGYIRGRRFEAVFLAEEIMRWAYAGVSRIAVQKLYGNYFSAIDATNHNLQYLTDEYSATIRRDQSKGVFGLYHTALGKGLEIVNDAVNAASHVYPVTISGNTDAKLYARAFSSGNGQYKLLITNKGSNNLRYTVRVNHVAIGASTRMMMYGGFKDENWSNGAKATPDPKTRKARPWFDGDRDGTLTELVHDPVAGACTEADASVTIGSYGIESLTF